MNMLNIIENNSKFWKHTKQCKETRGNFFLFTKISYTSCTANTVNVLLNVTGQIKIDNMLHIADVQTPCSHLENARMKSEYLF